MQNPINPEPSIAIITVVLTFIAAFAESLMFMMFIPLCSFIIFYTYVDKINKSNYKDSPVLAQIAKLLGYKVHKCGCVYKKNYSRHSTNIPESEWIEQENVYKRSMVGAKVRFRKKRSGMKRCTQCGNHYHTTESMTGRNSHRRICWPEEEPDVREELDHRVVES